MANGDPDPDPDGWDAFPLLQQQPLLRGMAYGPSQGEYSRDQLNGPLGPLQQGDLALSPNQQKRYPLGSNVDAYGENGQLIAANQRIADNSFISPHHPTTNVAEFWNGQDQGHVRLVPSVFPGLTGVSNPGGLGDQGYQESWNTSNAPAVPSTSTAIPTSPEAMYDWNSFPEAAQVSETSQAMGALGLASLQGLATTG
jgi:hypothetical protein